MRKLNIRFHCWNCNTSTAVSDMLPNHTCPNCKQEVTA